MSGGNYAMRMNKTWQGGGWSDGDCGPETLHFLIMFLFVS